MFGDSIGRIYPIELEIKDNTHIATSASYLDLQLECEGRLRTKLYDKRDVPIVNFLFVCSNIPVVPAFGAYISQLVRHSRACGFYHDLFGRRLLVIRKVLNQGFLVIKLKSLPCSSFFDLLLLITPLASLENTDGAMKKWTIQKNW